ncbi:bacteriocin immunity protein [Pseudomonas sp. Pf153]|uniref:bacteriocin immunity protein n=1 Tax=Pseudomonas sp. Pf153 TaxID=1699309 RepID=UPI00069E91B5|nr:bacteriocin immunity protein [Pseudomonas sp. Pf153]
MELKPKLQDYTETEFQAFVGRIWNVGMGKEEHDRLINHFDRIVGHPEGADLLFYPEDTGYTNAPETIIHFVKQWHFNKNVVPFKGGVLPAPAKPAPRLSMAQHATARAQRELANAQQLASDVTAAEQTVEKVFTQLELATRQRQNQHDAEQTLDALEQGMRRLEQAQHEVVMAVRTFERHKMRVEFALSGAQRDLAYNKSDQALWQANARQAAANHGRYLARLSSIAQRHAVLHAAAEAVLERSMEQLIRLRGQAGRPTLFRLSAANDMRHPNLLLSAAPPLKTRQRVELQKSIRSAVAEFNWLMTHSEQGHTGQYAEVLSFDLVSRTKEVRFGLCVALAEISAIEQDWQTLAAQQGEVALPLRMSTATVATKPGSHFRGLKEIRELFQIYITPATGMLPSKVRVRPAAWDEAGRAFRLTTDGPQPRVIEWTGADSLEAPVASERNRLDSAGFIHASPVPMLAAFDSIEGVRFDDYVVVFPQDSGLEPLYVVFNERRSA